MKNIPQRRNRARGSRHGGGQWGGFGGPEGSFEPSFGPGSGVRRGRRRRRGGDVRAAALLILAEQPSHGYRIITEIAERSDGEWKPSPGSIYPVLQQLEDEGLIEFDRVDGRKTASLTDAGHTFVEERREELGTPWDMSQSTHHSPERLELIRAAKSLDAAIRQVAHMGSNSQIEEATGILNSARKGIYGILASDEA